MKPSNPPAEDHQVILWPGEHGEAMCVAELANGCIALSALDRDQTPDPNQTYILDREQAMSLALYLCLFLNIRGDEIDGARPRAAARDVNPAKIMVKYGIMVTVLLVVVAALAGVGV